MSSSSSRSGAVCVLLIVFSACGARDALRGGDVDEDGGRGGRGGTGGSSGRGGKSEGKAGAAGRGGTAVGGRGAGGAGAGMGGAGTSGAGAGTGGAAVGGAGTSGAGAGTGGAGTSGADAGMGGAAAGGAGTSGAAAGGAGMGGAGGERCGDGTLQPDRESCDDGNTNAGDGCSVLCGWEPVTVACGYFHTCVLGVNSRVQCWGNAVSGQLGLGDQVTRGDEPGEMGTALPVVELSTERLVTSLFSGYDTSCAILDGGVLKCWGYNGHGGLGLGDTTNRGSERGQMSDSLPAVPLGRPVLSVAIGSGHVCALLDDGSVKCWGLNNYGQLGLGTNDDRGDEPNEIDVLPVVDLGANLTATAITAGSTHTCAILSDGGIKCWGYNDDGRLGYGDDTTRGDEPAEMGDALPRVALGTTPIPRVIDAGHTDTCVLFEGGLIKCWGPGLWGALGAENTENRGDEASEMGDQLPYVALASDRFATGLGVGSYQTCVILNDASVKCWGHNSDGALGLGDLEDRGDDAGEMGDGLPRVALGTGRTARALCGGSSHTCALLDDWTVKCWGYNAQGELGLGDTQSRGNDPGEMGDALPPAFVAF